MAIAEFLAALSAGGNGAADALAQQQKVADEQTLIAQRAQLEEQKAKNLASFNNNLAISSANTQRMALADRLNNNSPGFLQQAITQNAVANADKQGMAYYNPSDLDANGNPNPDAVPINPTYDQLPDEDQADPINRPTGKQKIEAQIDAALKTGDYTTAAELTKLADAGKVTAGYGGTVIDQNDIDPTTGKPRVLIDNSSVRSSVAQQIADARTTTAGAAVARAKSYASKTQAITNDQQLRTYNGELNVQKSLLLSAQNSLQYASKSNAPVIQQRIDDANAQMKSIQAKIDSRIGELRSNTGASNSASSQDSNVDYSNLWNGNQ